MIPGTQALAATGGQLISLYGKTAVNTAAKTVTGAFNSQRTVTSQPARLFTSKAMNDGETTEIEHFRKAIGKAGGRQNVTKLITQYPIAKYGLSLVTFRILHLMNTIATVASPAVNLAETITGIDPAYPIFLGVLGGAVANSYYRGFNRSISATSTNSTLKEVRQEAALQEACLKAQIQSASYRLGFGLGHSHPTGTGNFNTFEYGKLENDCFKKLGLDFESPLTRQDVLKAYEEKPEEFYAKVRLLGEYKN